MSTTNQLPELLLEFDEWQRNTPRKLPEHLTNILRSALQARAQVQAEVINEREAFESCALMEGSLFKRRADDPDKYWYGGVQDDWELWQARAILALCPQAVPMTDDEATAMIRETVRGNTIRRKGSTSLQIVRAVEAHYGITAKEKGVRNAL